MSGFDITPFLCPDDPWLAEVTPALVRQIYLEKARIAALLQPSSIVEIGVRAGYSAIAFLSACYCHYLGFDNWSDLPVFHTLIHREWAREVLGRQFSGRVVLREADTQKMADLPDADLVHVDGNHTFEGCTHDLHLATSANPRWILVDDVISTEPVREAALRFARGMRYVIFPTVRGDMLIQMRE